MTGVSDVPIHEKKAFLESVERNHRIVSRQVVVNQVQEVSEHHFSQAMAQRILEHLKITFIDSKLGELQDKVAG